MLQQEQDYQDYQSYYYEDTPEDEIKTVYIRVYQDDPNKPFWQNWKMPNWKQWASRFMQIFIQVLAIAMLSAFTLLPDKPAYTVTSITLPAIFLPLQHLQATAAIIPTGHKVIPATKAHGYLTFYNGSAFSQSLRAGFILTTSNGIEVSTDYAVTIPAENTSTNPPSNGVASVQAHALLAGSQGNIQAEAINSVYGSSIFVKNLAAFSGGQDSHTEKYATQQDKALALDTARQELQAKQAELKQPGMLYKPCTESVKQADLRLSVSWSCQFVTFYLPNNFQVLYARVVGRNIVVTVKTVELPK